MSAFFGVSFFREIFVTLLVITDPRASCRCSPGVTRGRPRRERLRPARQAAAAAPGVMAAVLPPGRSVLAYPGAGLHARPAAGGLLLLVALDLLTGRDRRPAAVRHRGAARDRRGPHARQAGLTGTSKKGRAAWKPV
jgi:small neutral amino acid transporter SnatA (MarC family)